MSSRQINDFFKFITYARPVVISDNEYINKYIEIACLDRIYQDIKKFDYINYIKNELKDQNLQLIQYIKEIDVPKLKLFKNNQDEINEIIKKNKDIRRQNEQIKRQNELMQREITNKDVDINEFKFDYEINSKLNKILCERLLKIKFLSGNYMNEQDYIFKAKQYAQSFFFNIENLFNQPVIIKIGDDECICRLYEVIDYKKTILLSNDNYDDEFFISYISKIRLSKDIKFINFGKFENDENSNNKIDYESLCQLDKIDIMGIQKLYSPYIINQQIELTENTMSIYEKYKNNTLKHESPLLKQNNNIKIEIESKLKKYEQDMIQHTQNFTNIIENMKI